MAQRTLRRGARGEDVKELQQLLAKAGYDPGAVDGIFGESTDTAVRAFQKANGLQVDGAIGPLTWAALSSTNSGGTPNQGGAGGRSLHIGINAVDNAAYGQAVPVLKGCENDARDMLALATAQSFTPQLMLGSQATAANVRAAISSAARELRSGDFFFLTISSHGSQINDPTGEEPDGLDETWVLYDRQLLDDELYTLWGTFQPGVRILVISDSCHSGTVSRDVVLAYRAFKAAYEDTREVGFVLNAPKPMLPVPQTRSMAGWGELQQGLRAVMPSVVADLHGSSTRSADPAQVQRYVDMVLAEITNDHAPAVLDADPITRNLPQENAQDDVNQRRQLYRDVKLENRGTAAVQASVLLISGCQDNQLSLDGRRNGLFTQRLLETWNNGRFSGSGYTDLHRRILSVMPPQQTPNLFWATGLDAAFEAKRPFTI